MSIRQVRADEWERVRAIRLEALADAPMAFGTTLAQALALADDEWQARAARGAAGETQVTFIDEDGERWDGMATGIRGLHGEASTVALVGVWVRPEARRSGVARGLAERVIAWARERGARRVDLWVSESNAGARRLYAQLGFEETGTTQPLPHTPQITELEMMLPLDS